MAGALFIWAGITDNSIIGLLGSVTSAKGKGSKKNG
jgi:hypothetical protein